MNKDQLFLALWANYAERTPSADLVKVFFEQEGNTVLNDHIAIRTFNDPRVNIDVLAKPFLALGYKHKGSYNFEKKKLDAHHFELEGDAEAPRVFISQLRVEEFDSETQEIIKNIIDSADQSLYQKEDLILRGAVWGKPSYAKYERLLEKSEYAAWMYINGFCANHFTVDVNALDTFKDLQSVNTFIKSKGFELNTSGGEIKGSKEIMLEQSSILADRIEMEFEEGSFEVTSCYYEFAFRHPKEDGELFSGFVAGSADKIFESTNMKVSKS
jgi:hypothetical protein